MTLLRQSSLAFGGVGAAGLMSEGERNLRALLERPDASRQLQSALAHATPAGTLYILVGLRRCDRAAYQKVFDSLPRSDDDVEVVCGCMISKEPFRQLLSEVQDGRFDDYLSRPPRWLSAVVLVRSRAKRSLAGCKLVSLPDSRAGW